MVSSHVDWKRLKLDVNSISTNLASCLVVAAEHDSSDLTCNAEMRCLLLGDAEKTARKRCAHVVKRSGIACLQSRLARRCWVRGW